MDRPGFAILIALMMSFTILTGTSDAAGNEYKRFEKSRLAGIDDYDKKCSAEAKKSDANALRCFEAKYPNLIGGLNCDSTNENRQYLIGHMCRLALQIGVSKPGSRLDRQDLIIDMLEYRNLTGTDYSLSKCSSDEMMKAIYSQSIKNFYCNIKMRNDDLTVTKSDRERIEVKRDHTQYICDKAAYSSRASLHKELQEYRSLMGSEFDFSICQALKGKISGIDR